MSASVRLLGGKEESNVLFPNVIGGIFTSEKNAIHSNLGRCYTISENSYLFK